MPKIYCSITVAVEHDDDPKAAIKANNAILSLIRKAQAVDNCSPNGAEFAHSSAPPLPVGVWRNTPMHLRPDEPDPDFDPGPDHGEGTDASGEPQPTSGDGTSPSPPQGSA